MKMLIISRVYHDCSAVILKNNCIEYYIMEERISRYKHDSSFEEILKYLIKINETEFDIIIIPYLSKQLKQFKYKHIVIDNGQYHHINHAYSGFLNSPFDKALCFVFDGVGSGYVIEQQNKPKILENVFEDFANHIFYEKDSVYLLEKNKKNRVIYKSYHLRKKEDHFIKFSLNQDIKLLLDNFMLRQSFKNKDYDNLINVTTDLSLGLKYFVATCLLGFSIFNEGKTMGLSQYKNYKNLLPSDYNTEIWVENVDKANKIQDYFQNYIITMLNKYRKETGIQNCVISGGCAMNCVANYEFLKYINADNLWIDPIGFDAGQSIGVAYRIINEKIKN